MTKKSDTPPRKAKRGFLYFFPFHIMAAADIHTAHDDGGISAPIASEESYSFHETQRGNRIRITATCNATRRTASEEFRMNAIASGRAQIYACLIRSLQKQEQKA